MTFFDNGPGFRDMRGLRKMGIFGRLQELFANISKTIQPILMKFASFESQEKILLNSGYIFYDIVTKDAKTRL